MRELLQFVVDFFNTIVDFVVMTVRSVANIVRIIPQFIQYVINLFNWLPDIIKVFGVLGISISVTLFLLGRDTN